jgi:DNA-directed RNA polymerase specialized sigma24 family protein
MDFRPYALRAIRNRMINFLEKTFSRAPKTEDLVVKYNQGEIDDEFYRTPSINEGPEYHTSITHEIDYEIVFNEGNLKNNSFTDKEIKIFSLYNNHGFTVTDIAKAMEVSMGQASKMLSSTLAKSNELWNKYHSN